MSVVIVIGLGSIGQAATALLATLPKESVILISAEETPDTTCICHSTQVIDSLLKVVEEYPYLKKAHQAAQELIKAEALLNADQRTKILKYLDLQYWNMEDIRKRIRRLKWQRIQYGAWGIGIGIAIGSFIY